MENSQIANDLFIYFKPFLIKYLSDRTRVINIDKVAYNLSTGN